MNESKDTEHTFARSTDLVLIKPIGSRMEPYTTTDKIAEFAEVSRKAVNQLLRRHLKDLEQFGKVEFEMEPLRGSRTGQRVKNAHLNEQQATLFITYLQNTPPVRRFKKRLVHAGTRPTGRNPYNGGIRRVFRMVPPQRALCGEHDEFQSGDCSICGNQKKTPGGERSGIKSASLCFRVQIAVCASVCCFLIVV